MCFTSHREFPSLGFLPLSLCEWLSKFGNQTRNSLTFLIKFDEGRNVHSDSDTEGSFDSFDPVDDDNDNSIQTEFGTMMMLT